MPNYCFNYLTVKGKVKDVKRFDDQFKNVHTEFIGGSTSCLNNEDLEKEYGKYLTYRAVPYSNIFATEKDKATKIDVHYIEDIEKKKGYSFSNFIEMTEDDFLNGWYDWSVSHWGTKWDCFDMQEDISNLDDKNSEDDCVAYYSYTTAWSPSLPVIIEMSKQYPNLEFNFKAEESGCGYAGVYELYNGEIIEQKEAGDGDNDYRYFMQNYFDYEYYKCKGCGALLEEYEIEDEKGICGNCGCNTFIIDGKEVKGDEI